MIRSLFFSFLLTTIGHCCVGQTAKYLVLFKDKQGTPFEIGKPEAFLSKRAIDRRIRQGIAISQRDLPVNPAYVSQVVQTGAKVWYKSKWLNALLVEATPAQVTAIKALSVVKGLEFNKSLNGARLSAEQKQTQKFGVQAPDYGIARSQNIMLGIDKMHDAGYHGEGMWIGVFDSGFERSNQNVALKPIFTENRILGTYDFVKKETSVYEDHNHGHNCFSILASFQEGQIVGPAYKASFLLCRTEDVGSETKLEEANWLFAAEMADSVGIDLISTSLGYSEFDNAADDYKYADMNGKTTLITRAADWAVATGMIVVVAAGNEGAAAWRYISAPADADSVLAVGAVNAAQAIASFSSVGPSADGRVKPDVCAMGVATVYSSSNSATLAGNGTSYSTPMMAGLVCGFWQANRHLTALEVMNCIRRAGHLFKTPNAQFGYGIPNFSAAQEVSKRDFPILSVSPLVINADIITYPNPFSNQLTIEVGYELLGKSATLELIDEKGVQFWSKTTVFDTQTQTIQLNQALANAPYLLRIQGKGFQRSLKLIKGQ